MAAKFLNSIDLNKTYINNAAWQNLASAPSSPVAGQCYYDTTLGSAYQWNGTAWVAFDASKVAAGAIPNTALTTNPLARANHTGTQTSSTISDLATVVKAYTLDTFAAPAASVAFNNQKITGLGTPTLATDGATKGYVDTSTQSAAAGIVSKTAVAVVSVANVASLSGLPTTDGITLVAGERILLTGQTTTAQNGPYVVAAGAWTRPTTDANGELDLGATWFVERGTTYASSTWRLATPTSGTITPGTTSVTITQLTAAATYTAGVNGGLLLTGSAFSVVANTGITVGASGVGVDFTLVPKKFSQSIGDGSTTAIVVTHNLGTLDVIMQCRDATAAPENVIYPDMQATTTNTATFTFATAPTTNQYRITCIG